MNANRFLDIFEFESIDDPDEEGLSFLDCTLKVDIPSEGFKVGDYFEEIFFRWDTKRLVFYKTVNCDHVRVNFDFTIR